MELDYVELLRPIPGLGGQKRFYSVTAPTKTGRPCLGLRKEGDTLMMTVKHATAVSTDRLVTTYPVPWAQVAWSEITPKKSFIGGNDEKREPSVEDAPKRRGRPPKSVT